MKTLILTIALVACATIGAFSQGKKSVVIGTMIDRPNAVLVINPPNKDQGFLLPQLSSTERLAIAPSSPQDDGLVVYDPNDKSFYYWSGGSWIKGLGDNTTRSLSYDPATQNLSLSGGGGTINLSTLKEVPSLTGQAGKYLTTDGTTLTWTTIGTIGDITSIIAGQGLTGGATSGDISLSVNTDGTTISVNGSNQLQLSDGAVTSGKIAGNAVNGSHIIDGSITSTEILDNTISTADLAPSSVTGPKIANNSITTTHITSGGNNKVLTTDGTGSVSWIDRSTFVDDNQGLSLAGNTLNIDNGASANLNNLSTTGDVAGPLNAQVIQAGAVNSSKIQDGSVTTTDLNSGGVNKVMTTDGTGVVSWIDRSTFVDDNQSLTLAGNTVNIDGGTGVDLNNITTTGDVAGALNAQVIQPGTVNSSKILDGSVTTIDLTSGGVNKVMTTDGTGVVVWSDRSTFTDNQNLSLTGSTLNIDNGTGVNLIAGGQVTGPLDDLDITPGASNQVMTTNAAGTASVWSTPAGDVTGPVSGSTVAGIQGRAVANTAPNNGDVLVWNGTAWAPAAVTVAPVTEYYAVDPAAFQPLEPSNGTNTIGLFTSGGGSYVLAKGSSRQIIAPVNLPHGATIQSITVFYEYTVALGLLPFNATFERKPFGAGNDPLTAVSPLLSLGVNSIGMPGIAAPDAVVDNSTYTYRVHITFNNVLDINDAGALLAARIYGIRIQYLK